MAATGTINRPQLPDPSRLQRALAQRIRPARYAASVAFQVEVRLWPFQVLTPRLSR